MNDIEKKEQGIETLEKKRDGLALELFEQLKKIIKAQWIIIILLIALMAATHIYHIYEWSQFDTIVVESGESGYANYIGNDGDINYGKSSSAQTQENEQEKVQGNQNQKE